MSLPDLPLIKYDDHPTFNQDGIGWSQEDIEAINKYAALAVAAAVPPGYAVVPIDKLIPVITIAADELETLRAEVKELGRWKSTNAPRIEALEGLKNHYHELAERGVEANKTLASEREANAILTAENEALRARVAELEKDASRYRWLRDIQKCWDFADSMFLNCSSEEHDAAIDAARGE
jgi:hypothetical protein